MAVIREEFVLADQFSGTFSRFLRMGREAETLLRRLGTGHGGYDEAVRRSTQALEELTGTSRRSNDLLEELAGTSQRTNDLLEQMSRDLRQLRESSSGASDAQNRHNRSLRDGSNAAGGLIGKLRNLAAAYLGLRSVQSLIQTSDTWVQTTARLDRMNDGQQTTPELRNIIYQSAQRSRGDYQETADMVGKLGTLAGDAFGSTAEVVAFAEQINKQFVLAGTSAQGAQAAMLQLTQALGSGVLRGEELNSILEQAPTITKAIADYLGVSVGEMRNLASEGKLTASVVKAAIFEAAEETNAAFEAIPLTFSQAAALIKNEALNALQPALEQLNSLLNSTAGQTVINGLIAGVQMLGSVLTWVLHLAETGAAWVMENWTLVSSVLIGGAVAIGGAMAASAAASAIAWAAANWPLLAVAAGVALVIYMAQQMGATWAEIGAFVGGIFGMMYATLMNWFIVPAQNGFARFVNFIGNVFNDPVAAIKVLFLDMATTILGYISTVAHGIENLINKIPGLSVSITSGIDGLYDKVKSTAQSVKDASGWKEYVKAWDFVDYKQTWDSWSEKGRNFGASIDNFKLPDVLGSMGGEGFDYKAMLNASGVTSALDASGVPGTLSSIGADTKALRNSVSMAEEDIKLLADLAEREYVTQVNLTAQTPVIHIAGQNTGDTDLDRNLLAEAIRDMLLEQAASHTDLDYT